MRAEAIEQSTLPHKSRCPGRTTLITSLSGHFYQARAPQGPNRIHQKEQSKQSECVKMKLNWWNLQHSSDYFRELGGILRRLRDRSGLLF